MSPQSTNDPPLAPVIRLLPEVPLPPYSFVPGRSPHPESDPAGHSFGLPRTTPPALDPHNWAASRTYLRGLDLFNAGFYWESHVEFESLWIACGRKGPVSLFLKGLIKLAAAGVKHLEQRPDGIKSHASGAARHWREVARGLEGPQPLYLGFRLDELIDTADTVARMGWPRPAPLLRPQALLPL